MKLVSAKGSIPMQQALGHSYVKTIVDIILQHRETLGIVAEVLQIYVKPKEPTLEKKLNGIRNLYGKFDEEGFPVVPAHIVNLTETLYKLYQQDDEKVRYQRGAVIELFARRLVCSRYKNDQECSNSRTFVDNRNQRITIQEVDVAALSTVWLQVEGYECKMKAQLLESSDCIDLAYLIIEARKSNYHVNVGIVSFDSDKKVSRRLDSVCSVLTHLPTPILNEIQVYGLDSIEKLREHPF